MLTEQHADTRSSIDEATAAMAFLYSHVGNVSEGNVQHRADQRGQKS
jgi:hypothetical protein